MSHRYALPIILVSLLAGVVPALADKQGEDESAKVAERAFVDWARGAAIPIDTLDWKKVDLSGLSQLDDVLKDKRIVYLGEGDHYIHEKFDYRMVLIHYLVGRGYRRIGMEMGRSDGKRIDDYLRTGDPAHLDRVAIFGYDGDQRTDRDDDVPEFTKGRDPKVRDAMKSECFWFQHQLRELSESLQDGTRLHWFGYDVSFRVGGAYADVAPLLAPHGESPMIEKIEKMLARVRGETRLEESKRLLGVVRFLEEHRRELGSLLGEADFLELKRSVHCLADSLDMIDAMHPPRDPARRALALRTRELTMIRQMDEILAELPAGEKVILLGHNMHLSKRSEAISYAAARMWRSVGTHLHDKHPGEIYAIWLVFNRGRHVSPYAALGVQEVRSRPGSVEQVLTAVGSRFLLPLQGRDPVPLYLQGRRDSFDGRKHVPLRGTRACGRTFLCRAGSGGLAAS